MLRMETCRADGDPRVPRAPGDRRELPPGQYLTRDFRCCPPGPRPHHAGSVAALLPGDQVLRESRLGEEGTTVMGESFEGRKVVVVGGGGSDMGPATAHQVVAGDGTVVITGRDQDRVQAAVETLSQNGKAWGITA